MDNFQIYISNIKSIMVQTNIVQFHIVGFFYRRQKITAVILRENGSGFRDYSMIMVYIISVSNSFLQCMHTNGNII